MRRHPVLAETAVLEQDTSPMMQQFIEQLATKYQVDVSVAGVRLWLALPGTTERLLIAGLTGQRISLTHCIADADEQLVCDTDLVFLIDETGWQPIELLHTDTVWEAYVKMMAATGAAPVQDGEGNFDMACFAEAWAELLTHQHWFEESQRLCV